MTASVHAAASFWYNRRPAGKGASAVKTVDENGGITIETKSGKTQKRSMVLLANVVEKSLLPTGIPIGNIAVTNVILAIAFWTGHCQESQPE